VGTGYGAVYAAAVVLCTTWAFLRFRRAGFGALIVLRGLSVAVWGGLIGAFVAGYLLTLIPGALAENAERGARWGGSTIVGVLLGGVTAAVLYCRWHRLPLGRVFDIGFVPVPLGQVIGRLGCLSAGCCYGRPTTSWLGMRLEDVHGHVAVRYPTQLMAAGLNLMILLVLLGIEACRRRRGDADWPFPGAVFLTYIGLWCANRFGVEFLRDTAPPVVGPLTWAHLATGVGFVVALGLFVRNLVRRLRENSVLETVSHN